jgi:hypothetical protein
MLNCQPYGICSWNYQVTRENLAVADLQFATFGEKAEIQHDGDQYQVTKEGFLGGSWNFTKAGEVIATASKPNILFRSFKINAGQLDLDLTAASAFTRGFDLSTDAGVIGTISPAHAFTRRAVIDCDSSVSIPLQLFSFTLAVFMWQRAANDSSAMAAGAG